MIKEWRVDITKDGGNQPVRAVIYALTTDAQWHHVEDQEFGPFDTTSDLARWLTRALVGQHVFQLA